MKKSTNYFSFSIIISTFFPAFAMLRTGRLEKKGGAQNSSEFDLLESFRSIISSDELAFCDILYFRIIHRWKILLSASVSFLGALCLFANDFWKYTD
jgi:hypothetical protein